jgi:hypothetical protein
MTRRRPGPVVRPAGARRRRARPGLLLAAALAVAGLAVLLPRWPGRARPASRQVAPQPDSIRLLRPDAAYQRALRLVNAGEPSRSLPYFRHALSFADKPLMAHANYAVALNRAALDSRVRHGLLLSATRASPERIALMREALAELDVAERMATTPSLRAWVHASRAHRLVVWGMSWDALEEFRRAEAAEPGAWQDVIAQLAERLRHPERPDREATDPATTTDRP